MSEILKINETLENMVAYVIEDRGEELDFIVKFKAEVLKDEALYATSTKRDLDNFQFSLERLDSRLKKIEKCRLEMMAEDADLGEYSCESTTYVTKEEGTMEVYMVNWVIVPKMIFDIFMKATGDYSHSFMYVDTMYDVVLMNSN